MRITSVVHILGFLLMFLAVAMLLPIPFSLYYGDSDYIPLLISAGITAVVGFFSFITTRMSRDIRTKEGFAVVTFGWIVLSIFGCLPFIISGAIPSITDAFFETISGFTTTGASILTDIEALPHGLLFWRSLTHWIGGMGIIVLSLAILPFLGVGGMQMFSAEAPGPVADKLAPRITGTAKILWGVYVLLSGAEAALLMFGGMSLFDALCHTFGTMATGGYSTRGASIGAYDSAFIDYIVIFFMLLAGTNFALHYRFMKGDWRAYLRNREFRFYATVIVVATVIICFDNYRDIYNSVADTGRFSLFQVVSIVTTTGYGTADYEQWSFSSKFVLFTLMFFGGCAGSTGGGIKMVRLFLLMQFAFTEIKRLLHPRAVIPIRLGDSTVSREVMARVVGFFVTFVIIFMISVFVMSTMGMDMATSLGAVAATLANIGPGLGDVGPTDNYAAVPGVGKWFLAFLMLLGRLELFTVLVLLSPNYWRK